MQKSVAVNEFGLRIGEDHHAAKLTDAQIEQIRQRHQNGESYDALAEEYEVSKWAIGRYCRYERRCQWPSGWRMVHIVKPKHG